MRELIKKKQMRVGAYMLTAVMATGMLSGCSANEEKSAPDKEITTAGTTNYEEPTTNSDTVKVEVPDFTYAFLKMEKKGNIVYSPLSMKYALSMLNEGANGNTKEQIESVIGSAKPVKYDNVENVLSLANAAYIRDCYSDSIKDEYKDTLSKNYNAEVIYDSFQNANNINSWIENKTFNQIKNMLTDDAVSDPNMAMILVNALAMDMEWKEGFSKDSTGRGPFYSEDGQEMKVAIMSGTFSTDVLSYYMDDNVTALAMDLEECGDNQMQFVAIMPNEKLYEYTQAFDKDTLKGIMDNMTKASDTKDGVEVCIPRFSIDYGINLVNDLKTLGITDAFDKELADFTNISDMKPFYVEDAIHKAKIDFTEGGIKAAAATVIKMAYECARIVEEPVSVNINKPFMYLIRDKKTGETWFVGTVYEPDLWKNVKGDYIYE